MSYLSLNSQGQELSEMIATFIVDTQNEVEPHLALVGEINPHLLECTKNSINGMILENAQNGKFPQFEVRERTEILFKEVERLARLKIKSQMRLN